MRDKILNIYIQSIMVANMETKTNYIKIQNEKKNENFFGRLKSGFQQTQDSIQLIVGDKMRIVFVRPSRN